MPSNGLAPIVAREEPMQDIGWLVVVVILFVLARALVRLCERLM